MIGRPIEADASLRAAFAGARVLVTGGAGFIAAHLAGALDRLGARVTLVDERPLSDNGLAPTAPLHAFTVGEPAFDAFLRERQPFEYLFHLAARAYAADSVDAPFVDFTANLLATVRLLEVLRQQGAPTRLVFASSAAVYGDPARLPILDGDLTVPISPYGVSKLAAERYVAVYSRLYGFPAASLRLFSVYGPGQRKQVVYDLLAKLRASPDELVVLGDGTQLRDLVYVEDVVYAFLMVAARGQLDGTAYNVATGVGTTTAALARQIVETQAGAARVTFTGRTRPGDPERWIGDSAALAALGGAPAWGLRDGLRATAAWFNAHGGAPAPGGPPPHREVAV